MAAMNQMARVAALAAACGLAATAGAQLRFNGPTNLSTPQRPGGAAIADFTGDGNADLVVSADTQDKLLFFVGNGDGTFQAPITILTGANTGPDSMAVGDYDGDLDPDLAVVFKNQNRVVIFLNNGGVLSPGAGFNTGADPRGLRAADLDNDGDPDLMVANRDSNTVTIAWNASGSFNTTTLGTGVEPRAVAAARFDNANGLDLVVTNHRDRTIGVYLSTGGQGFAAPVIYSVGANVRPEGVTVGNFDANPAIDIAVAIDGNGGGLAGIFSNNGSGVFSGPTNWATGGLEAGWIEAADFDRDGDLDLVVTNQDSNNVGVLENNTNSGFNAPVVLGAGTRPEFIAIGDLKRDTMPDFVVVNRDSDNTSVYINQLAPPCRADMDGNGTLDIRDFFAFQSAFASGDRRADFDNNGVLDIRDFFAFQAAFAAGC